MFKECRFLVILFSIMVLFLGCPSNHRISTNIPGKTTGDIYIDSPEVYTRERLVNDRLEQEAWLRSQLAKTDELEFGIQGLADIRSFLGISAALGVEADPLKAALKKAQAEQSAEGIKQQEEIEGETKPEEKKLTIDTQYDELIKLLAEPKSISTTGAKPSPIDLFRDRLAYREELRAELIENSLDDRHDLQGNTLYRLKFDTTIFPDDDTSAWAVIEVTIGEGGTYKGYDLYNRWVDFMKVHIIEEFARRYYYPIERDDTELHLKTIEELTKLRVPIGEMIVEIDKNLGRIAAEKKLKKEDSEYLRTKYIAELVKEKYRRQGLLMFLEIDESQDQSLTVKSKENVVGSFDDALRKRSFPYCYAITPKELVQRISDVASRREATQLSLSLGFLMGSVGLESLIEYVRVTEGIFQAIRRQPLVVGFSKDYEKEENATFGWMIGPKFSLQENGKGSYFRHAPVQQSLSALVSLPSWWQIVELKIKRYWRREDGTKVMGHEIIEYVVDLPGDLQGITDALSEEKNRPPIPKFIEDFNMEIGKPGKLVISGTDLWRSPEVFIGSQQADRISVLPNMLGIVAHFKEVKQPAGWGATDMSKKVNSYIWTSDGSQYIGYVTLYRSRKMSGQK